MAGYLRIEYPGAICRITVRGNGKHSIFLDDRGKTCDMLFGVAGVLVFEMPE